MWRLLRRTRFSLLSAFFCLGIVGGAHAATPQNAPGITALQLTMSFPGKQGELLNLREIEQMVDQLNRLESPL
ncbi:hypothetical protein PFLU3_15640 [Pseudomonas fluorescens]|uniref:ShlB POTRA domain-containing protein n=1 Tax=Pseudomonas fluorescens TaxID=294 RepID=A0A0D0RTG9_PSEFL|nr:Channel-forming transporter/cytolysins activator of TpsB family [Pseudomonas synxantha]KIR22882.1 hypothetical protein PFLU3_15640 [Pseudomonas fluorescens]